MTTRLRRSATCRSCLPVLPEVDFDGARAFAKARGYEFLSLDKPSTQVRVVKWYADGMVQDAREDGQRELAASMSPLPGKGGSA